MVRPSFSQVYMKATMFPSVMPGCRSRNSSRASSIALRCLTTTIRIALQDAAAAQLLRALQRRQPGTAALLDGHDDLRVFAAHRLYVALHGALVTGRLDKILRLDLD